MLEENDDFVIWDEQLYINSVYEPYGYRINPDLFLVHSQYVMDSSFEKCRLREEVGEDWNSDDEDEFHSNEEAKRIFYRLFDRSLEEVNERLCKMAMMVKGRGRKSGHYRRITAPDNNKAARSISERILSSSINMRQQGSQATPTAVSISEFSSNTLSLMSPWFIEDKDRIALIDYDKNGPCSRLYLVPPGAAFQIADAVEANALSTMMDRSFDFIVMDPPWVNLSVKRKRTYAMNDDDVLSKLAIPSILDTKGILAIWVTNSARVHTLVDRLLKKWKMVRVSVWYWLKTTTSGRPITSFVPTSSGKQPYEGVVFCVRKNQEKIMEEDGALPKKDLIIASIPMCVHSRKPSLLAIYRSVIPKYMIDRPLEIFARSLMPDCYSIGYEPLLLQCEEMMEKVDRTTEENICQ